MAGFRGKWLWIDLLPIFIIIFLVSWAGGIWLYPVGPLLLGTHWLPFLFVGIIFSLLIGLLASSNPYESTIEVVESKNHEDQRRQTIIALGIFFWIMVISLMVAILAYYL
ncbi:MAG: hypothetical protein ACQEQO_02110 [Thermodesulfobacteriota bacterium]